MQGQTLGAQSQLIDKEMEGQISDVQSQILKKLFSLANPIHTTFPNLSNRRIDCDKHRKDCFPIVANSTRICPSRCLFAFAKAIHGGAYPASLLALGEAAARRFATGTYGNTTSATPRALAVVKACIDLATPQLQDNIVAMGSLLRDELQKACCPTKVEEVRGVGLLLAIKLRADYSVDDVERRLRMLGLNAIHGGGNAIRITPWFHISRCEVRLISSLVRRVLGPGGAARSAAQVTYRAPRRRPELPPLERSLASPMPRIGAAGGGSGGGVLFCGGVC